MLDKIKNKHILIDGDIIKYRCAASAEKTRYLVETINSLNIRDYDPFDSHGEAHKFSVEQQKKNGVQFTQMWNRKEVEPLEFALQACKTTIDALLTKLEPSKTSIFLSPSRNFRDDIARTKPYKGNRAHVPKPKYLKEVEQYLVKQYGATFGSNVEADDEIGVALSKDPTGTVSVSIDKDLLQVSGWHYNWVKDTVQQVTSKAGDFSFYTQMLTGDATDNVPGINGIGTRGADRLLKGAQSKAELCSRVWNVYRGEFNTADKARAYFFEQAQLLWILRYNPEIPSMAKQYSPPIELK